MILVVLLDPPTSAAAQVKVIGQGSWAYTGSSILRSGSVARNEYRYPTQAACHQGRQTAIHNSRQGLRRANETLQRLNSGAIYWNREEQRQKAEFDKRFYSTLLNSLSGCTRIAAAGGAAGLANPGASTVPTGPTNAEIVEAAVAGAELLGALGEAFFGSPEERAAAARELRAAQRRNSEYAKSAFEGIDPYAEEGGVGCVDLSTDDQTCEGWDGVWSSDSWKGAGEDGMVDCLTVDGRPCSEADLDPFELKGSELSYADEQYDDVDWKGADLDELNAPNCSADPNAFTPDERDRWVEHCGIPAYEDGSRDAASITPIEDGRSSGLHERWVRWAETGRATPLEETRNILDYGADAVRDLANYALDELISHGKDLVRKVMSPAGRALFDFHLGQLDIAGNALDMIQDNVNQNFGEGRFWSTGELCLTYDHEDLWLASLATNQPVRRCP